MTTLHLITAVAATVIPTLAMAGDWKLVWADEFDKDGHPDPTKWQYEEGYIRNHEEQYYTKDRLENARVEGGCLVIEGRKEAIPNPHHKPDSKGANAQAVTKYTAASLNTLGKADWLYGRIEVRAKLPQGKGVWPAIWMMGTNVHQIGWPKCGEIDIMEFVGHTADHVYATVHYANTESKHVASGGHLITERPFDDFHIYAVEWYPDRMDFFLDQKQYFTFPLKAADLPGGNAFTKPHYLMLNLALGGAWGKEIDETIMPQKFMIDYVRVYQQSPAAAQPAAEAKK
jgi:beta-glucanase (GH16 family)